MDLKMKKRAFFFSLFVVMALALVVVNFKTKVQFREEIEAKIFKQRIEQLDFFIEDMEKDMSRALYISGYRAFKGAEVYIYNKQMYIKNVSANISEMMLKGTLNNEYMNVTNSSTLYNWSAIINQFSERFGLDINFTGISLQIVQASPWEVNITMNASVSIIDVEQKARWDFTIEKSTLIDISDANFFDPLYFMSTVGQPTVLENEFRRSPYSIASLWWNNSGVIQPDNLTMHIIEGYYMAYPGAPSYFMRLQGKFDCSDPDYTDDCTNYGIESIVDVGALGFLPYSPIEPNCASDYQYFQNPGCPITPYEHSIDGLDPNILFDDAHLVYYQLDTINTS